MGKRRWVTLVKRRFINVSTAWDVCPRPWERSFGGAKLAALKPYSGQVQVQVQVMKRKAVSNHLPARQLRIKCRNCRIFQGECIG